MKKYAISNVHCQNCVKKIENLFSELEINAKISDDLAYLYADYIDDEIISDLGELGFIIAGEVE